MDLYQRLKEYSPENILILHAIKFCFRLLNHLKLTGNYVLFALTISNSVFCVYSFCVVLMVPVPYGATVLEEP
jgi:hypothetical protein